MRLREVLLTLGFLVAYGLPAFSSGMSVGQIISTFSLGASEYEEPTCVYRDNDYVYAVFNCRGIWQLRTFSPAGAYIREINSWSYLAEADHSTYGAGYYTAVYQYGSEAKVVDLTLNTCSAVASWVPATLPYGFAYIPGSSYKYVSDGARVSRYTVGGSLLSSFNIPTDACSISATSSFAGYSGEYIVVPKRERAPYSQAFVYTPVGSLVGSFYIPFGSTLGAVCGPGYPSTYGTTLWCAQYVYPHGFIYQLYLGNGVGVEPASLGRVKAAYR